MVVPKLKDLHAAALLRNATSAFCEFEVMLQGELLPVLSADGSEAGSACEVVLAILIAALGKCGERGQPAQVRGPLADLAGRAHSP